MKPATSEVGILSLIRNHAGQGEAIVDCGSGIRLSYQALLEQVDQTAQELAGIQERSLVFLLASNTADFVVLYLACLSASLPVFLADPGALIDPLLATYRPSLVLAPEGRSMAGFASQTPLHAAATYRAWQNPERVETHEALAVLLPTSGSTGSPKLVRLREANLASNAKSIAEYLELGPAERAIQSLPMYYSYGLSVLNSHLAAGGTVILTPHSFMRPEFWADFDRERGTSFAGIPYMYEILNRLKFDPAKHPTLRTMTQAGGGLNKNLIEHFHTLNQKVGKRFVVMYGQTEATARISYVPPERLADKFGSIGIPIPGGRLRLRDVPGMEGSREMIYEGPNVMMGYAEGSSDLALGDVLRGVLETGDLAETDEDGYFHLTGRLNRFAKLFGKRISLEDIERSVEAEFKTPAAVIEGRNQLHLFVETHGNLEPQPFAEFVSKRLGVPPKAILVRLIDALPRAGNGKKNYAALDIQP